MTTSDAGTRTRTVVLGGGGAVGICWQVGVLLGLRDAGPELTGADAILGTSAGAVVAALLASQRDVGAALTSLQGLARSVTPAALRQGNDLYLKLMRQADLEGGSSSALRVVGQAAVLADTMDETTYLRLFDLFQGAAWTEHLSCTAIDADSGELVVWRKDSGVLLPSAAAVSGGDRESVDTLGGRSGT